MGAECNLELGSNECLKRNAKYECIYECKKVLDYPEGIALEKMISIASDGIELARAKRGNLEARNQILKKLFPLIKSVVEFTLIKIGNPRIRMESEHLRQEIASVLEVSISQFDPAKSSLKTFMTWQIRGELSNWIRKFETDKRIINFLHELASFQDQLIVREESVALEEVVGRLDFGFEEVEIKDFESFLTIEEKEVVHLILGGYEMDEIPDKTGVSHSRLEELLNSIKQKTHEYFE